MRQLDFLLDSESGAFLVGQVPSVLKHSCKIVVQRVISVISSLRRQITGWSMTGVFTVLRMRSPKKYWNGQLPIVNPLIVGIPDQPSARHTVFNRQLADL